MAASSPHTDGSIVFARWQQSTHPTWLSLPNGIWIGSDVFAHSRQRVHIVLLYSGPSLSPLGCPFAWGIPVWISYTRVHNQNRRSWQRDWHTDRQTTILGL